MILTIHKQRQRVICKMRIKVVVNNIEGVPLTTPLNIVAVEKNGKFLVTSVDMKVFGNGFTQEEAVEDFRNEVRMLYNRLKGCSKCLKSFKCFR